MKSYKIFIIAVTILILLNCALLGAFWYTRLKREQNGLPRAAYEYLSKELQLTPDQQKQYDVMRGEHFELTRKLNERNRGLRDAYFENIKTPVLDTAAAYTAEQHIITIQVSLDSATLTHFRKVRAILNTRQQTKFDQIIKNALHMMGSPPRPGPGNGHGPNDMPPPNGMPPPPEEGHGPPPPGN
jgi:Spy/CpxP family protein refolding chaperone